MTPQDLDDIAFRDLTRVYPHEVYAEFPDRFWEHFQRECPGVSRERMEQILKETEK